MGPQEGTAGVTPQELRCGGLVCPLGVDLPAPSLSWQVDDAAAAPARALEQVAYRVLVASSAERLARDEGDLWDSGRVVGGRSVDIRYGGKPLPSRQRCWWKVRIWTRRAGARRVTAGPWSAPSWWEMGLLREADWQAQWIGHPDSRKEAEGGRAPLFRREFAIAQSVVAARAYLCGLGYAELYVNGAKVGAGEFAAAIKLAVGTRLA